MRSCPLVWLRGAVQVKGTGKGDSAEVEPSNKVKVKVKSAFLDLTMQLFCCAGKSRGRRFDLSFS
jgi:hypothetical protein